MKIHIAYSLTVKDEFFLTLFALFLKEEKILATLSQNSSEKETLNNQTKNLIDEASFFLGIIFQGGDRNDSVIEEWDYAIEKGIPNLLFLEEGIDIAKREDINYLKFSRDKYNETIYEIDRRMLPHNKNYSIFWLLVGTSLKLTLEKAFLSQNKKASFVLSGRLRLIEDRLLGIDSAAFQNLCDIYLALREPQLVSINRTGSQFGKQKTVKGTPDTFFRLADGSLRYVEFTTKVDGLVAKIKEDIDKCLDSSKTGVPADDIDKIIIFFNARIDVAEETAITQYANSKNIRIELIGLDWLALEIYSKYLILAKDILGVPLDTGQLLPLQNFINEYNNKAGKLSTPLDNPFLHRKTELENIENILASNDLLIISGFPGVGKTKIALEALNNYLKLYKDYLAFAISIKDQDISEDLKIHLQQEGNYILLVDDANRQLPNFKQILGVFKEQRKGNIKLLITVRDYALNDVINECRDFSYDIITLSKFTDEEITQLISSDAFEIKNSKYQKRIVEIADGNARLAVMASRLALQEQVGFLYGDGERIFELYDFYFKTFIKDFDIFGNKILIKTLGIISFFFTVDRSNKGLLENILNTFELDYHDFNEAIDDLEKRELVEVKYNSTRVSEQVMATYFFYKVFIKDGTLSFKALLFTFFPTWKKRFADTIIPSNNSFGYANVLKKISYTLDEYLHSVYSEEEKVLAFFDLFWFYKREEMLNYFYQKIKQFPEPENPHYNTKYEMNDFVFDKDDTLKFLVHLFDHFTESFIPGLELSFEYCRKKPESLPELIRRIREKLLFDEEDEKSNFQRQQVLFNLLIEKFKIGYAHYVEAFFALAGTFLSHHYQITKSGRNNIIVFYQYPMPFNEVTKDFREAIWITLFDSFKKYPKEIFAIIKDFRPGFHKAIPEILEFDLSLLIPFIEQNLDKKTFENVHFIHDFVAMLDREDVTDKSYQGLKTQFYSKEYEYFRKLDWNTLRGRQDFDFEKREDFEKLKEEDVRKSFVFKTKEEFSELHNAIKNTLSVNNENTWGLENSLNIIAEENFLQNNELGFQFLESILKDYTIGLNPLYKAINAIVTKSDDWALRLWNLLKDWKHDYKIYWQLSFFDSLPKESVNDFYRFQLIKMIESISVGCYLRFDIFEKFIELDKNIFLNILDVVVKKIEEQNLRIQLGYRFFENYSKTLDKNIDLLSKAYIQQQSLDSHFDLGGEELKTLLKIYPRFLIEYISICDNEKQTLQIRNTANNLPFVWDIDGYEGLMEEVINIIIENERYYGILEHPIKIFFSNLNEEQSIKAKSFVLNYIAKYNASENKINAIFDVIRHRIPDFFEEAFLHYLNLNTDLESFEKIWWRGNGGSYSGNVIIGEIQAKDWQRILSMVEKSKNQLDLIPIKTYIKRQIEYELKNGEEERRRKFLNPYGLSI